MKRKKRDFLTTIIYKGLFGIVNAKSIKEVDKELIETVSEFSIVLSQRYLEPRRLKVPKSTDWYVNILPSYDELRFKSCVRVNRLQFKEILSILSTNTPPQTERSKYPLETQLAIALFRFGHDGSGASYTEVGSKFGVSDCGMIQICTEKIIQMILTIERDIIKWPGEEERDEICDSMRHVLPGCLGYIDGCHIPLFQAPADNHEAYYSRKQQYAIQLQAVCDNSRIFRNVAVGYPASAHDARVFSNSHIGQYPEQYFRDGQWIAGDSAYRQSKYLVTPFRDNATTGTPLQRRQFNIHFSGQRVKIEQCFGLLKKIFGSLRSLRIVVDKRTGHKRACEWIMACVILYNIIQPDFEETNNSNHEIENEQNDIYNNANFIQDLDAVQRNVIFNWFINQ